MPRQFQFVAVSNPTGPVPSESRKLSHAHVTREAHAKERRLRVQRYRKETMQSLTERLAGDETPSLLVEIPECCKSLFSASALSLSPQERFLLDHYIRIVVPYSAVHCGLFDYPGDHGPDDHTREILKDWVGLAMTDKDLLDTALLLKACRSILRSKPGDPAMTQMALQYRQRGLQSLQQALTKPVSIITVTMAFALVFDEEVFGEIKVARQHLRGVFHMVELSGGLQSLGLSGLLELQALFNPTMPSVEATIPFGSLVLVTGATGFVASHVTRQLLERGYRVRGTVRDLAQASWLIDDHFKWFSESGHLELVEAPNLVADGAFNEAVKGVSAIAHIATISNLDPNPHNIIPQTVAGATGILKSAVKEPSVRRVVFTSSIMAAVLPVAGNDTRVDDDTWNEAAVEAAWAPPPYEPSRTLITYAASKVAAERAVWSFVEQEKPRYTLNVICPSGIIGEPLHKKHAEAPTNWIATHFRRDKTSLDPFPAAYFVDVKDIVLLHVAAILDPQVENARLHSWGHSSNWNEFLAVLREIRPQREFIADYPDPYYVTISTDQSDSLTLLEKWAGQEGWRPLRTSIIESVESPYFQL
ncbi:Epimerase domain-containing protein [Fusarium sp. LHS14.1]|nr:Epimerase domain-containing protein [Fusarium sp. LHS14.1]